MFCLSDYERETSITKLAVDLPLKKIVWGRGERVEFDCLNVLRVWREKWFVNTILSVILVAVVIINIVEANRVVREIDLQWPTGTKRKILGP